RVVVDGHGGVGGLEALLPGIGRGLDGAGAGAVERAGEVRVARGGCGVLVRGATGSETEQERGGRHGGCRRASCAGGRDLHECSLSWSCPDAARAASSNLNLGTPDDSTPEVG